MGRVRDPFKTKAQLAAIGLFILTLMCMLLSIWVGEVKWALTGFVFLMATFAAAAMGSYPYD